MSTQKPKSYTPQNCPVCKDSREVTNLGRDMARAIRKLRRDLRICRRCAHGRECPVLAEMEATISQAIAEVAAEWGLERFTFGVDR